MPVLKRRPCALPAKAVPAETERGRFSTHTGAVSYPAVLPSLAWVALCAMPIAERMSFAEVYEVVTCGDKAILESYSPRPRLWDLYWVKSPEVRTNG